MIRLRFGRYSQRRNIFLKIRRQINSIQFQKVEFFSQINLTVLIHKTNQFDLMLRMVFFSPLLSRVNCKSQLRLKMILVHCYNIFGTKICCLNETNGLKYQFIHKCWIFHRFFHQSECFHGVLIINWKKS